MSKLHIRKALEARLNVTLGAQGFNIIFGKMKLNTALGWKEYLHGTIAYGDDNATEIGSTPRIEVGGTFTVDVRTNPLELDDRNDIVADLVRGAYPYGLDLFSGGIRVNILTVDDSQCIADGSFLYSPVDINFMVWER